MNLNLFVYGTLMSHGDHPHRIFHGLAEFVGRAQVRGRLYSTGAFPALVYGDGIVHGQLWRAKPETIGAILFETDRIEGYRPGDRASMYLRREVPLLDRPGETTQVYIWNYGLGNLKPIPNGDWRAFERERYGFAWGDFEEAPAA